MTKALVSKLFCILLVALTISCELQQDNISPQEVPNIVVSVNPNQICLSWEEPSDSDFAKVFIESYWYKTEVNKGQTVIFIPRPMPGKREITIKTVDTSGNISKGKTISFYVY